MSLANALLAVVAASSEPLHGHAIARQLARLFDGIRPVNRGQVYATLRRLTRDGLLARTSHGVASRAGTITLRSAGRAALDAWLAQPAAGAPAASCELIERLVVATALGDRALVRRLLDARHERTTDLLRSLTARRGDGPTSDLVLEAARRHLAAELAWLADAARVLGDAAQA